MRPTVCKSLGVIRNVLAAGNMVGRDDRVRGRIDALELEPEMRLQDTIWSHVSVVTVRSSSSEPESYPCSCPSGRTRRTEQRTQVQNDEGIPKIIYNEPEVLRSVLSRMGPVTWSHERAQTPRPRR